MYPTALLLQENIAWMALKDVCYCVNVCDIIEHNDIVRNDGETLKCYIYKLMFVYTIICQEFSEGGTWKLGKRALYGLLV